MTQEEKVMLTAYIEDWEHYIEAHIAKKFTVPEGLKDDENFIRNFDYYTKGKRDAFENAKLILGFIKDQVEKL